MDRRKRTHMVALDRLDKEHPWKACVHCRNDYPATTEYFAHRARNSDGLDNRCKDCMAAYRKRKPR
jgi:hypothetical protein